MKSPTPTAGPAAPGWPGTLTDAARWVLPIALALLVAGLFRWTLQASVDLDDLPGANGTRVIARAATGEWQRGWDVWLVGLALPVGGDVVSAARLVALLGGLLGVGGAVLGGWALGGRAAATGAGLVAGAGTWSAGAATALYLGPDAPAIGLAWLAVGASWAGFRATGLGLGWLPVAAVCMSLAAATKDLALPAVALVALGPLMHRGRGHHLLGKLALFGIAAAWAWGRFSPDGLHHAASMPALSSIADGLRAVLALPANRHPEGIFEQLLVLAALAGLAPGPAPVRRAVTAVACIGVLGLSASAVGDLLRPRYLLAPSFGLLVLAGTFLGLATRWWLQLPGLRRLGPLAWTPMVVAAAMLSLDTWAWAESWASFRHGMVGTAQASLAPAPAAWARRYEGHALESFTDVSIFGAMELRRAVEAHPDRGIAIPALRDQRQVNLAAYSRLAGAPFVVLEFRTCCPPSTDDRAEIPACAAAVVKALDEAGMALMVPLDRDRLKRVDEDSVRWVKALRAAAEERGPGQEGLEWWSLWEGSGTSRAIPCGGADRGPW